MSKIKKVIILHEYGAPNHYLGLSSLLKNNNIDVVYREFSFLREIAKGFVRFDLQALRRGLRNAFFFFKCLVTGLRDQSVVVGIAPYDYRVLFLKVMLRNSKYFLHTSWPLWFGGYTPKRKFSLLDEIWSNFFNNAKEVFTVTQAVKENICMGYDYPRENLHVVYHSYNEAFLTDKDEIITNNNKVNAIFVGRVEEEKGVDIIVELAKLNSDVNFHIVGEGSYIIPEVVNLIGHGAISDKNELAALMKSCDLLLLPSKKTNNWQDVFGIVIIEGLSCGLYPLVTSQIGPEELLKLTVGECYDESNYIDKVTEYIKCFSPEGSQKKIDIKKAAIKESEKFQIENISKKWSVILEYI